MHDSKRRREDRKRRRARKKASGKAEKQQKESDRRARAVAKGGEAPIAGRKALSETLKAGGSGRGGVVVKNGVAAASGGGSSGRSEFGKSTAVFARIQEHRDQSAANKAAGKDAVVKKDKAKGPGVSGATYKL